MRLARSESCYRAQMPIRPVVLALIVAVFMGAFVVQAQRPATGGGPGAPAELDAFKGVTTDGVVRPGLYSIKSTGVTTKPVMDAANQFIASLTPEQRSSTTFPVDAEEWRRWNNVHRAARAGMAFKDMTEVQQARALDLLRAALSARGLELTRNVMRLNHTIAEITNNFTEYGEGLYNFTLMGEPSAKEPWGWQLEGHHLIINYFVLGDQVVMSPAFWGSEPVVAESGKYKGVSVLQDEQSRGLAFMQMLSAEQQKQALITPEKKTANNAQGQAYRDNLQMPYAGIAGAALTSKQRDTLLDLIALYVKNMDDGHARVKLDEVRAHLNDTHFGWIGEYSADSVFYYRVHSPVLLIEFDHQTPVALKGPREPGRQHIHSVVRTPNGNDYGKDLLRLHYQQHSHQAEYGTAHRAVSPTERP
jgi:hypothetical protein